MNHTKRMGLYSIATHGHLFWLVLFEMIGGELQSCPSCPFLCEDLIFFHGAVTNAFIGTGYNGYVRHIDPCFLCYGVRTAVYTHLLIQYSE